MLKGLPVSITSSKTQRAILEACVQYLHQRYKQPLTISCIATQFNISPHQLKSGFKKFTGYSIHNFLIKVRMDQACWILVSTDEPIKNIPQMIGYRERNFFDRFQKMYKCTPLEYRLKQFGLLPESQ